MTLNTILLQAAQSGGGSGMTTLLMILAMVVIFYFFMIRPQSKQRKEMQKKRDAMKAGDKVVTAGGIHGRVREIGENTLVMEIDKGVEIRVNRDSVYPYEEPVKKGEKKAEKK